MALPGHVNSTKGHENGTVEENEQNGSQDTTSSDPALPATNGDLAEPTGDLNLSSCTPRSYIPTPYNSPVRQNPRQTARQADSNGKPSTRLRGGGPTKRSAGIPNGAPVKKTKIVLNHRATKKERMLDDPDAVLADGNSLLYSDVDIAAVLQHPTAMNALAGLAVSDQLNGLSEDVVRRAIGEFVDHGRRGFNDPDFLGQCLEARERRAAGEFDPYLEHSFRETWLEGEENEIDELSSCV
ncbi:hypothetical protein N431DRAFT_404907 [Stipitochalara longipes BDJ]|nr:hypothetical protein N431DRAFT_404907 [Stipitochalara longipes BDJ]